MELIFSPEGLKPLRPPTLGEMAIIVITEQQLSLAAAFHIRTPLIARLGARVGNLQRFPTAKRLVSASLQQLMKCDLSRREAGRKYAYDTRLIRGVWSERPYMLLAVIARDKFTCFMPNCGRKLS